ncbi:replication-relaxation family protein [Streptomyces sp. NPDC088757]|uniref:replication-relaxation family protein n=1 Tax=Streptomyces sp. NPDC088757 TaxID=3365889 RepID=UPI0037F75F18
MHRTGEPCAFAGTDVDTAIAFYQAEVADHADWQVEVTHHTPSSDLLPDGVVLLDDGFNAFVEIDRTMSYARLINKLECYDAYHNAPAARRGNAARAPRSHWQETYAGLSLERPFPAWRSSAQSASGCVAGRASTSAVR